MRNTSPGKNIFPGFPPPALDFFRGLEANNNRDWFEGHKQIYEESVRQPFHAFAEAINAELARFAPDYITESRKAVFRIYRDTRFSKDKTPYKDHQGAVFNHRLLGKMSGAGFYCGISHKEVEVAGGAYMPPADHLLAIRNWLAENHAAFRKQAGAKAVTALMGGLQGERLSRPPKGFADGHPAMDLLKGKQFYYYVLLEAELATTPRLLVEVMKRFRAVLPVVEMLNRPLIE